jgi:plasmid rolling circle replication initiator protein Rep
MFIDFKASSKLEKQTEEIFISPCVLTISTPTSFSKKAHFSNGVLNSVAQCMRDPIKEEELLELFEEKKSDPFHILKKKEEELLAGKFFEAYKRLSSCSSFAIPSMSVFLKENSETIKRRFGGLATCNNPLCPVCGPRRALEKVKILQKRAKQVWEEGDHYHCVLTVGHDESCNYLVREISDLLNNMLREFRGKNERFYKRNCLGFCRQFEVTHGRYGFHPHTHLLISFHDDISAFDFKRKFEVFIKNSVKAFSKKHKKEGRIYVKYDHDEVMVDFEENSSKHQKTWFEKIEGNGQSLLDYFNKMAVEVSGSSLKSKAPWNMPIAKYAQLLIDMKTFRWTGTGGIWKKNKDQIDDEDDEVDEKEQNYKVLFEITARGWAKLPHYVRRDLQIQVNIIKSRDDVVNYVLDILNKFNLIHFVIGYYSESGPVKSRECKPIGPPLSMDCKCEKNI